MNTRRRPAIIEPEWAEFTTELFAKIVSRFPSMLWRRFGGEINAGLAVYPQLGRWQDQLVIEADRELALVEIRLGKANARFCECFCEQDFRATIDQVLDYLEELISGELVRVVCKDGGEFFAERERLDSHPQRDTFVRIFSIPHKLAAV